MFEIFIVINEKDIQEEQEKGRTYDTKGEIGERTEEKEWQFFFLGLLFFWDK